MRGKECPYAHNCKLMSLLYNFIENSFFKIWVVSYFIYTQVMEEVEEEEKMKRGRTNNNNKQKI